MLAQQHDKRSRIIALTRACAIGLVLQFAAATSGLQVVVSASAEDVPTRDYGPMELGAWLFYPSLLVGGVFNDNLFSTPSGKIAGVGLNIQPSFVADWNSDLHQIRGYGTAGAQLYVDHSDADIFTGQFGFKNTNQAGTDIVWQTAAEIGALRNDLKSTFIVPGSPITTTTPQEYGQFLGSASFRKTFNLLYTEGGISYVGQDSSVLQGNAVRFRIREGYAISPLFSLFIEPAYNLQSFQQSALNSSGFSIVGGVASPRISLFAGEVYAGYFNQQYSNASIGPQTGPTYGGNLSWFMREDLTLTAAVSQAVGLAGPNQNTAFTVGALSGGAPDPLAPIVEAAPPLALAPLQNIGVPQQLFAFTSPGSVTTAAFTGTYLATQAITLSGTVAYQTQAATGISPAADTWAAVVNIGYSVNPAWVLNLNYLFSASTMSGGVPNSGTITNNVVTAGVNMRL